MTSDKGMKTAREIINEFFSGLEKIEGMDKETASIIQKLWSEDKLGRDEMLSELKAARNKEGEHGEKEA